jgi:cysteine synthase A
VLARWKERAEWVRIFPKGQAIRQNLQMAAFLPKKCVCFRKRCGQFDKCGWTTQIRALKAGRTVFRVVSQFNEGIPMHRSVIDAIGNTPLIRLKRVSEETGCEILGKAEFMNPGQSVKDRAGLFIIRDAERRGLLRPGGVIVEGTAGNTGIGLTLVAKALGYRTVIVIPDTQSQEKKDTLRVMGAELIEVPAVPYKNPNNYVKVSGRLAEQLARSDPNGAIWANQFDNIANREGHIRTTAEEIWTQTGGKVDGFVSAVGTGGTLAGVAFGLKDKSRNVKIALADPLGAALFSFYTQGVLKAEGSSITEGIGQGRITANLEDFTPDFSYQVPDEEALPYVFDLIQEEGICLGGSSGINIAGAIRLARELGPGHTIVTILADYGTRYQSKLFNPEFLRSKNLPVPGWMEEGPQFSVPFEAVA